MEINMNTPALLFPTVSLILLAYTNRFLAIANLVRNLHSQYEKTHNEKVLVQINSLRRRLEMIRYMQGFGVSSLFTAIVCMFFLYIGWQYIANAIFGISLLLLMLSLSFSLREILVSINALNILLSDMDKDIQEQKHRQQS